MEDEDPLINKDFREKFIVHDLFNGNRRGRPCTSQTIKFCPQPQSIVSLKFSEENKSICNDFLPNSCDDRTNGTQTEVTTENIQNFKVNKSSSNNLFIKNDIVNSKEFYPCEDGVGVSLSTCVICTYRYLTSYPIKLF